VECEREREGGREEEGRERERETGRKETTRELAD
jgi:hypothetical protein